MRVRPYPFPPALLALGGLTHLIVWTVCLLSPDGHLGDFQRYWDIATTVGLPYVDTPVEYPPAAVAVFQLIGRATGDRTWFYGVLLLANLVADAVVLALLVAGWGTTAGATYVVISAPIVSLLFFRFDLWPVAAATAGIALWTRQRRWAGLAALGVGVALKLWPLPLAAVFLAPPLAIGRTARTALIWAALAGGAAVALWLAFSGVDGLLNVLTFRRATGWNIEGTIGSVWRILEPGSVRVEAGAIRVGHAAGLASVALFLISLPLACWAVYRGAATHRIGTGWVIGVGVLLAGSALLSPQFLGWLLPGAAIAWVEGDRRTTRWLAGLVALTVVYRVLHTTQVPLLVLGRNVMLVAMVGDGLRRLVRGSVPEPSQNLPVLRFQSHHPPAP